MYTTALSKNLLALFALVLAALLYFLYLGLFPSPRPTPPFNPLAAWQLSFPDVLNASAGYSVIAQSAIKNSTLFFANNASAQFSGTYSHHPHLHVVNGSSSLVLLSFSNGMTDEDADGQQVLYLLSTDGGLTFGKVTQLFPPAAPPARWQPNSVQRAMCSEGFIQLKDGRTFAVAELYGQSQVTIHGEPHGWRSTGYGRVAREVNSTDGSIIDAPCWIQRSPYVDALTEGPYSINNSELCEDEEELLTRLSYGSTQPAWSWALLSANHPVLAANASMQLAEPTHALPFNGSSVCRFWRLLNDVANRTLYVECATNGTDMADPQYNRWFNGTDLIQRGAYGPYPSILPTNIPDAGSKSVFGAFPPSSSNSRSAFLSWQNAANLTHFLISNPNTAGARVPLTIATSVDASTFSAIAALHPAPPPPARYDGRYKNAGYQYPSAAILPYPPINGTTQDVLLVTYSVNKEDIWISRIAVRDLPRGALAAGGSSDAFGKGFVFFVLCAVAVVLVGGLAWKLWWSAPSEDVQLEEQEVTKQSKGNGWHEQRVALTSDAGDDYEEELDDDEEEDEDEEEESDVHDEEVKNGHLITSADVAHYVATAPRTTSSVRSTQRV